MHNLAHILPLTKRRRSVPFRRSGLRHIFGYAVAPPKTSSTLERYLQFVIADFEVIQQLTIIIQKGFNMRRRSLTILIIIFFAISSLVIANPLQEQTFKRKDVPPAVLKAFEQAYPKAKMKGFSKEENEGKMVYEIESVEGKFRRDILYNPDGTVVSVEESLSFAELPQAVRDAIAKEYPKAKATRCEKIIKGSTTQFEVVLKSGKEKYEVIFESDGKISKKEKL